MTAFENLRKASEAIIAICEKEQHTKEDKNRLLKINEQISTAIEDLVECEGCNRIVTANEIATIALGGKSAKLCKDCGIKSLEAGKIYKKKPTRRRTRRAKKVKKTDKPETAENTEKAKSSTSQAPALRTEKPVPEPPKENPKPDLNELYGEVEAQTGINKRDVKKIHKLIEEIAVPMDLENTIIYTVAELEKARMRIERPAAEKAVAILFNG
ncbi:MAG: hypothetical protein ACE5PV_25685 [Candidatus Poribacteria bacterium]